MLGFLIGTACLIGFVATARRARYACACGGGWAGGFGHGGRCGGWHRHDGHWHGHGRHAHHHGPYRDEWDDRRGSRSGFGFGSRAWLSMLSERLDLTPAQEKAFRESYEEVRQAIRKSKDELRDTRRDVAKAIRAGSFDAVLLGETFSRHDGVVDEVRKAIVGALARIHESLDERQREGLAQMIEDGPHGFHGFRGARGWRA